MRTHPTRRAQPRREPPRPDPLPSWNEGATKRAILAFLDAVTGEGGANFVPEPERVAVFDNDGTLWCEKPIPIQFEFAIALARLQTQAEPELKETQPYLALLKGDVNFFRTTPANIINTLLLDMVKGLTPEEFERQAQAFLHTNRHPRFGVPWDQTTYTPMRELLDVLRAHGFRIFLNSGGGADFMRTVAEELYGVHRDDVIGSAIDYDVVERDGHLVLLRSDRLRGEINEGAPKIATIQAHIGRRPILVAGNSQGDADMLRYADSPDRPHLALLVDHDDPLREYAYASTAASFRSKETALQMADQYGWTVVSMRRDFRWVFDLERPTSPRLRE